MRLTGTSVQNGTVCCVCYLCPELYSGARLLFLSCRLVAGFAHRTLQGPTFSFFHPCPFLPELIPYILPPGELLRLLKPHRHPQAHMHMNTHPHTHPHTVLGKAQAWGLWVSGFSHSFLSVPSSLSHSLYFSLLTFPFRAGVLELSQKSLKQGCHPCCALDHLCDIVNIAMPR